MSAHDRSVAPAVPTRLRLEQHSIHFGIGRHAMNSRQDVIGIEFQLKPSVQVLQLREGAIAPLSSVRNSHLHLLCHNETEPTSSPNPFVAEALLSFISTTRQNRLTS